MDSKEFLEQNLPSLLKLLELNGLKEDVLFAMSVYSYEKRKENIATIAILEAEVDRLKSIQRYDVSVGNDGGYLLDSHHEGELVKWEDIETILNTTK